MHAPELLVGVDATCWWNERGFGRFTRELVTALVRRKTGFRYVLFTDREPAGELPEGALVQPVVTRRTVTDASVGSGARSPLDLWTLGRGVARAAWDLLFFPAVYSYFPVPRRGPCVVAFHDTIPERYPELVFPTRANRWLWRAKVALARRQARRVMTVSQASARDLVDVLGFPADRIDVVSEAADPRFRRLDDPERVAAARRRYRIGDRQRYLVYVGGLNPHKNLLGLLRAAPGLFESSPDLALVIVGDTSGRGFHDNVAELRAFAHENPLLEERVLFTGYVPDEDLVALYNGATAFVLPSLWEGFGLPALEAMACGLPVVASDRGSLPEVVGDAGRLFDPLSPDSIARAIAPLLRDEALHRRLAEASRARAARYTWDRGAELAEACFRRALGRDAGEGDA